MLKTVILAENPLDTWTWQRFEVEDIREFLLTRFDKWPDSGRIYHNQVASSHDVTPYDDAGIERLGTLEGTFYCIIYPAGLPELILAIVTVLAVAVVLLLPKIPTATQRNTQAPSPNNELSERTNRARPNGRIPDIFGTVRSTPDLIAAPYSIFIGNQEVEFTIMCIGRGQYEIHDVYDGETLFDQIAGSTVQIYAPNTNINSGEPYFQIGSDIVGDAYNAARSNSVNGQLLRAPNANSFVGASDVTFHAPDTIELPVDSERDFTSVFFAGDTLQVRNAVQNPAGVSFTEETQVIDNVSFQFKIPSDTLPSEFTSAINVELKNATFNVYSLDGEGSSYFSWSYNLSGVYEVDSVTLEGDITQYYCRITLVLPATVNPQWNDVTTHGASQFSSTEIVVFTTAALYDLFGDYEILAVSNHTITLADPADVNPDWLSLPGGVSAPLSPTLSTSGPKWVGPFILESSVRQWVFANFISLNGLYKDNGNEQYAVTVEIEIEVTPINLANAAIGSPETFSISLTGSAVSKETRAATLKALTTFQGRCSVRARRVTESDLEFEGSVIDEVKWRDLYSISELSNANFGDVTLLRSQSYATAGALTVKDRKLNLLVTRQIPQYLGSGVFSATLHSSTYAADILSFVSLDQKIGNRQPAEIDFDNIYETLEDCTDYFGTPSAASFSYTFDKDNLSFEETAMSIANTVFCTAYRLGNRLKISFEKETEDSLLLFNHRNKIPGSETRTVTFGNHNDNDGVEFEYVSSTDDALVTFYLPADQSAANPKKIESVGVRSFVQAHFHAWRAYNKIRYQNTQVEFDATQEADLLVTQDRILVADNTRPNTQDGEVVSQDGLIVHTSQDLVFESGVAYSMFLQLYNGTVEAISVTQGPTSSSAVLAYAPALALALDDALYAKTTYILVGDTDLRQKAFLVAEKITQDNMTSKIRAANYDVRYYEHDKDLIDGIITE